MIGFPKPIRAKKFKIANYILRGSKYNNIPSQYKGRTYHSRLEAEYAIILDDMIKHKEIKSWVPQFPMKLEVNGKKIATYIADFLVTMPDGSQQIHETKGYFSSPSRIKWKLAEALYGQKYR